MSSRDGYCPHGVYVGGIGVDWMCGACEAGEPAPPPPARVVLELELGAPIEPVAADGWARIIEHAVAALPGIRAATVLVLELDPDSHSRRADRAYELAAGTDHDDEGRAA